MQWVKEDTITNCMRCNVPFTALRRKHHCRVGRVPEEIMSPDMWEGVLRFLFLAASSCKRIHGARVQRLFCDGEK